VPYLSQVKPYLGQVLCKCLQQEEAQGQDQQGKLKNNEVDSHAAHVGKDGVSITSTATSLGTLDSISTVTSTVTLLGTMDSTSTVLVTNGKCAQLCLDLNKKVNDPNALLAKFKAACAESTNVETNVVHMCTMLSQT
jgi:hypothetical protein